MNNTHNTLEKNNTSDIGQIFNEIKELVAMILSCADNESGVYDVKGVANYLECSVPVAREIMKRKDFPRLKVGTAHKVSKIALLAWSMVRRD